MSATQPASAPDPEAFSQAFSQAFPEARAQPRIQPRPEERRHGSTDRRRRPRADSDQLDRAAPLEDAAGPTEDELLRQLLATAPMVVFVYDREGSITMCEGGGLEPRLAPADLLGRSIWDLCREQPDVTEHFRLGLSGESGELTLQLGGGDFSCQYGPLHDAEDRVVGVSGVAVDVTELRRVAKENAELSGFLAAMSHELRTPLNSILGFAQLLLAPGRAGATPQKRIRYVQNIEQSGHQLLALINDILDLSKVKAGLMQLEPERLEARDVLHLAAIQMGPIAEASGVEIVERPAPPMHFAADRRRVHQILLNLLSNAVKATSAGGRVELASRSQEGGGTILLVTDSGRGIAADRIEVIFDEYRQLDENLNGDEHGTGLGLSLSRRFAVLMGGSLDVESELGVGSAFQLRLPDSPAGAAPSGPRDPAA